LIPDILAERWHIESSQLKQNKDFRLEVYGYTPFEICIPTDAGTVHVGDPTEVFSCDEAAAPADARYVKKAEARG
jgi:hypothetical protein